MASIELSSEQRTRFQKAKEASDRKNHDYAIALLKQLVKEVPGHIDMRRLLRANELLKFKGMSAIAKKMTAVKITPLTMKAGGLLKKDPQAAIDLAEDILEIDPTSPQGNQILGDAAKALQIVEVELLAYETLRDANPSDPKVLKNLGRAYLDAGLPDKAQTTFQKALDLVPTDGEALKGVKDSSAMNASKKGAWDEKGDFRQSLKSADEAKLLEQQSRVVKSDDAIDAQLAVLGEQYEQNSTNLNIVKQIADLYERKGDLNTSLQWFNYAYELGNRADPEIEKKIHSLNFRTLEGNLQSKRQEIAEAQDEETKAALEQELAVLEQHKAGFALDSAKERVARYPNDKMLRYDLGKALYDAGQYREAVPELQQAIGQPNVRHQAYNYLGLCYMQRNMSDLALKQFQTAAGEMIGMDSLKKEVIYNLALCFESMGRHTEAIDELKKIYEVDYQYRDVADRVERSYEKKPEDEEGDKAA